MKTILCIKCQQPMPELRFIKFGYKHCINCSTIDTYKAINTINGEGDHTWNDIQIITTEQYNRVTKGEGFNWEEENIDGDEIIEIEEE